MAHEQMSVPAATLAAARRAGALATALLAAVAAVILGAPGAAGAHHSFSAYYFEDQSTTVEGDVVEFEYKAPHAWVRLAVVDATGRSQIYAAEWSNPNRLARDSVQRDTLRPGDRVRITGSPGRDERERRLHLKRIERPADGWHWANQRRR
jgi:hypothetical protein